MALNQHTVDTIEPKDAPFDVHDNAGRQAVKGLVLVVRPYRKAQLKRMQKLEEENDKDPRKRPRPPRAYYAIVARGQRERLGDASQLTLAQARKLAKDKIALAITGHDFRAERAQRKAMETETLGAYLEGAYRDQALANLATGSELIQRVKNGFPHLLKKPMSSINDGIDMAKWRKARGGVSLETQRRELSYLKAVLNHAVRSKLIAGHQLTHYRVKATAEESQAEGAKQIRFLTDQEEVALREAMRERDRELRLERASGNQWRIDRGHDPRSELGAYADHLEPIVLLALNTGLRRGDLLGLRWSELDLERGQVTKIIAKSSHARRKAGRRVDPVTLPLSSEAVQVLTRWQTQTPGELVFPGREGKPLTDIKKGWQALLIRAGIHGLRFHDLRHTFASRLVMAGVDLNTVRELMTHSDLKMTLVYAHLSPDHKAAALERAFGSAS